MTQQSVNAKLAIDSSAFRKALRKCSLEVQDAAWTEGLTDGLSTLDGLVKVNIVKRNLIDRGRLLNSWDLKVFPPSNGQAYGTIGTNIIYARIHEYGGIIKPRTAKMLAWKGKDGQIHFAHSVTIKAKPYFRPAFDEGGDQVNQKFLEAVTRILYLWGAK